jgi:hypothetical protein
VKHFVLLSLLAVGCAHAPATAPGSGGPDARTFREMVRAELLAAARPASEFSLFQMLNGEWSKIGVLTSTGTSVNNGSTGVTFTLSCATVVFQCDTAQANVGAGATCDTDPTGANHKKQIATAWEPYYMLALPSTTQVCLDAPAATTINCAVFCLK